MSTEEKERVKPFRFRPMLCIAAACLFGALFAYLQYIADAGYIFTAVFAVVCIAVGIGLRKKTVVLVALVLAIAVNIAASITFDTRTPLPFATDSAEISGRVAEVGRSIGGTNAIVLTLAVIDGIPVDYSLEVKLGRDEDVAEGDFVRFTGKCESIDGAKGSYELGLIARGIGYRAETDALSEKTRGEPDFFGKIKQRLKDALLSVMPKDDAGVVTSLLFGDKEYLSAGDYELVKASGTAHMFAVSGLHVGFLVGAALWVLKKLKANRFATFFTILGLLAVYGFLCGFPASFNRAAVMSIVMLFSALVHRRYDALSALAFAAVLILLFEPLSLFTTGFQMSFAALLGITLLYRPIKMLVKRALRFDVLSSSVALSLASTLGIYPVTAAYFGTFSTYFIFSNLIVVPLVGVTYLTLFAAMIPALIAPSALSVLFYPGLGLVRLLSAVTVFFGTLPASLITVPPLSLGAAGYYAALVFLSAFCVLSFKKKAAAATVAVLFALVLFATSTIFT